MSDATRTTVLVAAFEGWNDACQAATNALRHIVATYESREVRHIRCDGFYDYQVSRPMSCSVQGRRRILWPQTTFYDVQITDDLHILAQIAPEPNYRWQEYCRQTLRIAEEFEVDHVITLGSMFADCPHTRPLPLDISDGESRCDMDREYNGPVGIPTVLDDKARTRGYNTTSIWVSIPQYLNSDDCPQASLRIIEGLSSVVDTPLDTGELPKKAEQWIAQASMLVRCNEDLSDYITHLEHDYDLEAKAREVASLGTPQAEQLVREAEDYLRGIGNV